MGAIKVSSLPARRGAMLAVAVCALAAGAAPAHAQEPGVVYEPGSPSGKEYAIPLEEARTDAGGAIPGSAETRAFGIGVSRQGRGDRGSAARGDGPKGSRGGARKGGTQTEGGRAESRGLRERLAAAEAAGAPAFWTLVPLLLVLLPGLLVGLLLARRGRQHLAT